ncbi:mannose-1-phosphate guanyltransferase [Pyrenophora teres f. teres]|nr:mannose-1-phosphate guanyltransferase [Pyrenophora teres f. teres]
MKAIILVGGFGTRLRPLTLTLPKPLVEFANKPMIQHQIEALAAAGVTDVVLAVNYRPEIMAEALKAYEKQYNVTITFSVETEPLGTAGPLKLAENVLGKDDSPFFVLNADVTCDYPFKQLAEFHKSHGDEGTIVVTKVEEPSKYGVVVHKPGHASKIDRFVEKPVEFVGNRINAGIYIMNTSVLKRIELRPTSIEQETFPAIVKDGLLHSFDLEGFWMDVGQPKDFLTGTCLYLSSLARKNSKLLTSPSEPYVYGGNVLIDPQPRSARTAALVPMSPLDLMSLLATVFACSDACSSRTAVSRTTPGLSRLLLAGTAPSASGPVSRTSLFSVTMSRLATKSTSTVAPFCLTSPSSRTLTLLQSSCKLQDTQSDDADLYTF